jgi:glutathione S-transferase
MAMPIQLYCLGYQDRSDRVRWLLEEMKVTYQDHFLNRKAGDLNTPAYRRLNPMGRVPTLVDGDVVLHESAAICFYLADTYGYGELAPRMEDKALRAEYVKWFTHVSTAEEKASTHAFVKEQSEIFKLALNPILEKHDFILPSGFSAADIMLGAVIPGAHDYLVLGNPAMEAYMKRLMTREAAVRAKVF